MDTVVLPQPPFWLTTAIVLIPLISSQWFVIAQLYPLAIPEGKAVPKSIFQCYQTSGLL
jgi:hypothetical protein